MKYYVLWCYDGFKTFRAFTLEEIIAQIGEYADKSIEMLEVGIHINGEGFLFWDKQDIQQVVKELII